VTDVIDEAVVVAPAPGDAVDEELVRQLSERARAEGLRLTGEGGLLSRLTKMVVESALEGEMEDHLGHARHDPAGRDGGNSRNGTRSKELLTEAGRVQIAVPRTGTARLPHSWSGSGSAACPGSMIWSSHCPPRGSPTGRSAPTWPRSTARRSPSRRSPPSLRRSWRVCRPGRAGRWIRSIR
jgi:hypothetical protein